MGGRGCRQRRNTSSEFAGRQAERRQQRNQRGGRGAGEVQECFTPQPLEGGTSPDHQEEEEQEERNACGALCLYLPSGQEAAVEVVAEEVTGGRVSCLAGQVLLGALDNHSPSQRMCARACKKPRPLTCSL